MCCYPFGSLLPGRNFSSDTYRYGFNGYENDDEIKSVTGSHLSFSDYGYDPRIGRRLNVDPQFRETAWRSPYSYAANSPIQNIDIDGERDVYFNLVINEKTGKAAHGVVVGAGESFTSKNHYKIHVKNKDGKITTSEVSKEEFYKTAYENNASYIGSKDIESIGFKQSGIVFTREDAPVAKKEDDTDAKFIDGQSSIDGISEAFGAQPGIDPGGTKSFGHVMEGVYESVQKAVALIDEYFEANPISPSTTPSTPSPDDVPDDRGSNIQKVDSCTACTQSQNDYPKLFDENGHDSKDKGVVKVKKQNVENNSN